jgi:hypothetical protein
MRTLMVAVHEGTSPMLSKAIHQELDHGGLLLSHELFHLRRSENVSG